MFYFLRELREGGKMNPFDRDFFVQMGWFPKLLTWNKLDQPFFFRCFD